MAGGAGNDIHSARIAPHPPAPQLREDRQHTLRNALAVALHESGVPVCTRVCVVNAGRASIL